MVKCGICKKSISQKETFKGYVRLLSEDIVVFLKFNIGESEDVDCCNKCLEHTLEEMCPLSGLRSAEGGD